MSQDMSDDTGGRILDVKADDRCSNCYCDFADHDYDAERDEYICPNPHQDVGYGGFKGGDPRNFTPDHECCSATEIAAWKEACARWTSAELRGETLEAEPLQPCVVDGVAGAGWKFGIGMYVIEREQTWEALR